MVMSAIPRRLATVLDQPHSSDQDLVDRVLAGERLLFAVLVRRYNQRLYRIVRSIVRNDAEAEDVVQQALVSAFHKLAQFRADAAFSTWLSRIAMNEALGRIRDRRRFGPVELVEDDRQEPFPTPAEELYRRELGCLLESEIDLLPDTLRTVLVLRDVQELDTAETAACLGITESAVRVRLHRARHALQERLSRVMEASPEVFRFDGERCDRTLIAVASALSL
jgi:RNA polymerase sigma-70 factor (ECF subfamily)